MTATTTMLFVFLATKSMATCSVRVARARALIFRAVPGGNPTTVIGALDLEESNRVVTITGNVGGLPQGPHGIHIHQFGDLGNGCLASGGHYSPFRSNHGAPQNPPSARHVGDLGNIMTNDSFITFAGLRGIVGRAFVIHSGRDDLGTGGNQGSITTGNVGSRLACGVIGYVAPRNT